MKHDILLALWYFLPAGIGNMVPILAAKAPLLRKWDAPLDFGKTWRGQRLLGSHKTIRGLVCGVLAGAVVGLLQGYSADWFSQFTILPQGLYEDWQPLLLGALLAFGALLGDAIKSFFKRQVGIAAGKSWFPFDQIDYIVGACVLGTIIIVLSLAQYMLILLIWTSLHLISSYVGFLLKLKSSPI